MARVNHMLVVVLIGVILRGESSAQQPLETLPGDAIATWVFHPREAWSEQPPSAVIPSLRAALATGLIQDEDAARAARVILALAAAGEHPHRLVLTQFHAQPKDVQGGMDVQELEAVLEIRTKRSHRALIATIESVLVPDQGQESFQRPIDLPGGRRGVEFVRDDYEPWARVAWLSEEGVFTVGIGSDPLRSWLRWRDAADREQAPRSLKALREQQPGGRRVVEGWVDLNRIRQSFPLAFDSSRLERVLGALRLTNARAFALTGWSPTEQGQMVQLDWSVESRANSLGEWGTERLAEATWPDGIKRPSDAVHTLNFPLRVRELQDLVTSVYRASRKPGVIPGYEIQRRRWFARRGDALRVLSGSAQGRVLLADVPAAPIRFPGIATVVFPLRPGADIDRADRALTAVLSDFSPELRKDARTGIWSVGLVSEKADPAGLLRFGAIGIAGERPALIISWSPGALVQASRLWAGQEPR